MRDLHFARIWWALWGLAVLLVVLGSLVPAAALPAAPQGADAIVHVLAYLALMFAAAQLLERRGALLAMAVGLALLGLALECAQLLLPTGRRFEWSDAAANAIGALAGLGLGMTRLGTTLARLEPWIAARR